MSIDIDTFYYFVDDMGLRPLWWELYKLDKYPALRYMLIMEQIHCEEIVVKSYDKKGKLDELSYSKDMHQGIFNEIMLKKLRITPGKEHNFFTIAMKIEIQKCIWIKSSDQFPIENKLNYMKTMHKVLQLRLSFEPSFISISKQYVNYLEISIAELEKEHSSIGSPISQKFDNSKKELKAEQSFESFFSDQEMIEPILNYLHQEKVLNSEKKWIGINGGSPSDFMGFIDALRVESIIEFKKITAVGMVFKKFLAATVSERSMRDTSYKREDACEAYRSILVDFKLLYNQS